MKIVYELDGFVLDLFGDESIQITETLREFSKIDLQIGSFTQSFTIPATANNNAAFKHWYLVDILGGFNPSVGVKTTLNINDTFQFIGITSLESVEMNQFKPANYKIQFFGSIKNLASEFGERTFKDIDLSSLIVDINYSTYQSSIGQFGDVELQLASFDRPIFMSQSPNIQNANCVNTPTGTFELSKIRPVYNVQSLVTRIMGNVGLTASGDFMTDVSLNRLYILPMNAAGAIPTEQRTVTPSSVNQTGTNPAYVNNTFSTVQFNNVKSGNPTYFNLGANTFIAPYTGRYYFEHRYIRRSGAVNVVMKHRTRKVSDPNFLIPSEQTAQYYPTLNSVVVVTSAITLSAGESIFWEINPNSNGSGGGGTIEFETFSIALYYWKLDVGIENITPAMVFPDMKIVDFLQGLATTFNLIVRPNPDDSNDWQFNYFDKYITTGKSVVIDDIVDIKTVRSIPKKIPAKYSFKHEIGNDLNSTSFRGVNLRDFGNMEFAPSVDFPSPAVEIKTPFTVLPVPILTVLQTGQPFPFYVPQFIDSDGKPVQNKMNLFFRGVIAVQEYYIQDNSGTPQLQSAYSPYLPFNDNVQTIATKSLSFSLEMPYPDGINVPPTKTLFDVYFQETIENFYNEQTRFVEVSGMMTTGKWIEIFEPNTTLYFYDTPYKAAEKTFNPITGEFTMKLISFTPERITRVVDTNPVGDITTDNPTLRVGDKQRFNIFDATSTSSGALYRINANDLTNAPSATFSAVQTQILQPLTSVNSISWNRSSVAPVAGEYNAAKVGTVGQTYNVQFNNISDNGTDFGEFLKSVDTTYLVRVTLNDGTFCEMSTVVFVSVAGRVTTIRFSVVAGNENVLISDSNPVNFEFYKTT